MKTTRLLMASMLALGAATVALATDMPSERSTGAHCPVENPGTGGAPGVAAEAGRAAEAAAAGAKPTAATIRKLDLPKMITQDLYLPKDVCADAKANNPGKRFALVAGKTHLCDRDGQVCLKTLRDVSDTCNHFVRDNFALYHTRIFRLRPHGGEHVAKEQAGSDDISEQWAKTGGPNIHVIDLSDCKVFPVAGPGLDSNKDPKLPASERFRLMQEQVLRIPGVREAMGAAANYTPGDAEKSCLLQSQPTIDQAWSALEGQSDALEKAKGKPIWE